MSKRSLWVVKWKRDAILNSPKQNSLSSCGLSLNGASFYVIFKNFLGLEGAIEQDGKELKGEFGELDSGTYMNLLRAPGAWGSFHIQVLVYLPL